MENLSLRLPDFDVPTLPAPLERLFVGGEVEVDVLALDGAADVLDAPLAIAGGMCMMVPKG